MTADLIRDTCGYAVPFMSYDEDRSLHASRFARETDESLDEYFQGKEHVGTSIDGLPGAAAPAAAAASRVTVVNESEGRRRKPYTSERSKTLILTVLRPPGGPAGDRMAEFPTRGNGSRSWLTGRGSGPTRRPFYAHVVIGGEVAGNVVSWEQSGQRMVGYWLGRVYWGRGIATAALTLFVAELSRPLYADVAAHNLGSIRVLEKCGFHRVDPRIDSASTDPGDVIMVLAS